MPKGQRAWSEEERRAVAERLKAAREKKKQEIEEAMATPIEELKKQTEVPTETKVTTEKVDTSKDELIEKLMSRLDEMAVEIGGLKAEKKKESVEQIQDKVQGASISETGEMMGVFTKYPLGKGYYPDPVPKLQEEPFLARFAFKENYVLKWDVQGMVYETKWGSTVAEPKFTLTLYQRQYDDLGEPTGKLIRLTSLNIFEDPASVRQLMVELDMDTDGLTEKEVFDIIRYHRIKEWLKNFYQPPKNISDQSRSSEVVIDGRVVVMEEESSVIG